MVIWTTTTWTLPGNRAIAYGPDDRLRAAPGRWGRRRGRSARVGETLLVAMALLPQVLEAAGITTHHLLHVFKGSELAGTVAAHPLRGQGYEHDVPLLPADYVTTDQGTGFVHTAPSHGEEDFALGREYGLDVPETVQGDGTYSSWVPLFAGLHVFKASGPVSRRDRARRAGCSRGAACSMPIRIRGGARRR